MVGEIVKRCMFGIAYGGIFTFIALTIVMLTGTDASVSEIWLYMLSSFIIGIYFGVASLIFEDNGWSYLKKTVIHFSLSVIVYYAVAIFMARWIPLTFMAILISFFFFVFIYAAFFVGHYLYFKKVEESMNAHLKKKE